MAEELARELGLPVIQFNTDSTDKAKDDTPVDHEVQFIPAKIHHDGGQEVKTGHADSLIHLWSYHFIILPPKIGTYFTKFIQKNEEKGCLEASLRGRPLEGEILQLPEGYEAAVIQAVGSDGDTFREVKRVQQVTYWNYDKVLPNLIHMT